MGTVFPGTIDNFTNPIPGPPGIGSYLANASPALQHALQHGSANDACEAIETKVGVDGSTDPTSFDYRIAALEAGGGALTPMTKAALIALRDGPGLDLGAHYAVNDWTSGPLTGPNMLIFTAVSATELSTAVLVSTPLGLFGPNMGTYVIDFDLMIELKDLFGNQVYDGTGAATGGFPWGNPNFDNNRLRNTTLVAADSPTNSMTGCVLYGGTIDFTNATTAGSLAFCRTVNSSIEMGPFLSAANCDLANITLTNTCTANVQLSGVRAYSTTSVSSLIFGGSANTIVSVALLEGDATTFIDTTGAAREVNITDCELSQSSIAYSRTTGADQDSISALRMQESTLSWSGATDPGLAQTITGCAFTNGSLVTVVNGAGAAMLVDTVVSAASTLNVQAGGRIRDSRVAGNGVLNTGAFAHDGVAYEFQGTTTLTANNTGTYKGFGASNVV